MNKAYAIVGYGFLLSVLLTAYTHGQISMSNMQLQQSITIGAQVYDGLVVQFEVEQIPLAERNPLSPAIKLYIQAQTNSLIDYSFLNSGNLGSCELPLRRETESKSLNLSLGLIQSCTIFSIQSIPVFVFTTREF
jgi:hypothetical protein